MVILIEDIHRFLDEQKFAPDVAKEVMERTESVAMKGLVPFQKLKEVFGEFEIEKDMFVRQLNFKYFQQTIRSPTD